MSSSQSSQFPHASLSASAFSPAPATSLRGASYPLARYGWDEAWDAEFAPYAAQGLVPGRVVRVDRGRCDLVTADGEAYADTAYVTPHDPLRVICTGDWAAVDAGGEPRYVRAYLPRRTAFVRSTSSKRSEGQILAANVDHTVIAVSLAAELDLGRVERFLALGWESGARPVLALTKADLVADPAVLAHLVRDVEHAAPGVPVLAVSAETGSGIDALSERVAGTTTVLLGVSGAGKSTLVNALTGTGTMDVQAVRDADGKGRHTTTTRNLLPLPGGGAVIDTPGLRGVGLWDAGDGVGQVFAEIEELATGCRFQDCVHTAEPGCAVLAAVEAGELSLRRLESYRKLQRENLRILAKTDARTRAQLRREWKARSAQGRAAAEVKHGGGRYR